MSSPGQISGQLTGVSTDPCKSEVLYSGPLKTPFGACCSGSQLGQGLGGDVGFVWACKYFGWNSEETKIDITESWDSVFLTGV